MPKVSKKARRFIARWVKHEYVERGRPMRQAQAIAYSKARKAGYKVPKRR